MTENLFKLIVTFPDGTVVEEEKPTDTFVSTLCRLGLEKVNGTGYLVRERRGVLLVGKKQGRPHCLDRWLVRLQ